MNSIPRSVSVLKRSVLAKHIDNTYGAYWYDDMIDAFEGESVSALSLAPTDSIASKIHREEIRPFILKLLLFVGVSSEYYVLAARLIETLAVRPQDELNNVLRNTADRMKLTQKALASRLDRCFNLYDVQMFERISYLTRTTPLTARDAIIDLAGYVRVVFYSEVPLP